MHPKTCTVQICVPDSRVVSKFAGIPGRPKYRPMIATVNPKFVGIWAIILGTKPLWNLRLGVRKRHFEGDITACPNLHGSMDRFPLRDGFGAKDSGVQGSRV